MPRPELPDDDDVPVLRHWGQPAAAAAVVVGTVAPVRHIHKWGPFDFLNDDRRCACGASKAEVDKAKHAGKGETT